MKTLATNSGVLSIALGFAGIALANMPLENAAVPPDSPEIPVTAVAQLANNPVVEKQCWPQAAEDKKTTKAGFVQSMIKITPASPKGNFKTGDSAFEVVALPAYKKEYRLEISLVFDLNLRKQSEVLVPSVVIVDGNFCEITDLQKLNFTPTYGAFAAVEIEKAFVEIGDENPKYALIYTDARFADSEVNVTSDFGYGMQNSSRYRRVSLGYVNVRINK